MWTVVLGPGSGRLIGFGRVGLLTEAGNVLEREGKGRVGGLEGEGTIGWLLVVECWIVGYF